MSLKSPELQVYKQKNFNDMSNKKTKELKINIDEILYFKMILNSNVEDINVWKEDEQKSEYANMLKSLYKKVLIIEKQMKNEQ